MTKRLVPLLVLAFTLTVAPAALANHCRRCHPVTGACVTALNFGFAYCQTIGLGDCDLDLFCGDHSRTAVEPLAADFTVASVERLDRRQETAPAEMLVASTESPASTTAPADR